MDKNNILDKTILVVDDERINQRIVNCLLENYVNIISAEDGIECINVFCTHSVDMILMDFEMPRMNGMEAAIKIRDFDKEVPIIMYSAYLSNRITEIMKRQQGAINDYLNKPCCESTLKAVIDKYLK